MFCTARNESGAAKSTTMRYSAPELAACGGSSPPVLRSVCDPPSTSRGPMSNAASPTGMMPVRLMQRAPTARPLHRRRDATAVRQACAAQQRRHAASCRRRSSDGRDPPAGWRRDRSADASGQAAVRQVLADHLALPQRHEGLEHCWRDAGKRIAIVPVAEHTLRTCDVIAPAEMSHDVRAQPLRAAVLHIVLQPDVRGMSMRRLPPSAWSRRTPRWPCEYAP